MSSNFVKDPDALIDYKVDWQQYLNGDDIVSAAVTAFPQVSGGVRVAAFAVSSNSKSVVIWLSAGVTAEEVNITNRVWTSAGRRDDRTFFVSVENK